jgi:hypothetical protein
LGTFIDDPSCTRARRPPYILLDFGTMDNLAEQPLGNPILQEPSLTNQRDTIASTSSPTIQGIPPISIMPDISRETYAASCNPARRAKQPRTVSPSRKKSDAMPPHLLPILPKRPQAENPSESVVDPLQPTPAKRGRKPGPLSRMARETQRKLNHSIIEKARRTKINDALATLRKLVPVDYGYPKDKREADSEDEYQSGEPKKDKKSKGTGKREEKEKEFKLEILIRTVSFMQDLLVRVETLEAGGGECPKCSEREPSKKRKRDQSNYNVEEEDIPISKRVDQRSSASPEVQVADEPTSMLAVQPSPPTKTLVSRPYLGSRLPSISSWLPNSQIDPILLSPSQREHASQATQLPSPPSSARFDPVQTSQIPPALVLGPVATSSLLSPRRTPEDESAASLLLQISASSPQLLPISEPSFSASFDLSTLRTACVTPGGFTGNDGVHAQTPGTMLGLTRAGRVRG